MPTLQKARLTVGVCNKLRFYCRATSKGVREPQIKLQFVSELGVSFFFLNKFIYLFIFGCVGSLLLRAGFLWLHRAGATPRCNARASLAAEHGL